MRRSSSSSCSSSSSSSYSCGEPATVEDVSEKKPRAKRARRNHPDNADGFRDASSPSSTRRSSIYRGVTRHRGTGRFEAHLWDRSSWNNIQNKKGKQVYLGAYNDEEAAARTYDLAALKYWGPDTILNFPMETYEKELEEMQNVSKEEYLASLRRRSSGFSRGVSKYRGVARHHHNGRWEARIGRVHGNKYLYLGTYNTQEEAAAAYDMAALQYRGPNAVTNFDISNYVDRLKSIGAHLDPPRPNEPASRPTGGELQELKSVPESASAPPPQRLIQYADEDHMSACLIDPVDQLLHLPWGFCTDIGHHPLPVPESGGESLPDPFEDRGFEEDIDLIFEVAEKDDGGEGDIMLTCGGSSSGSTSSSPSLSTTTSVSCSCST